MEWKGRRVAVIGLARSGVAACRALASRGAQVIAYDLKSREELAPAVAELEGLPVELRLGAQVEVECAGLALAVVSPGVPLDAPMLAPLFRAGVEVIGEVELAYRLKKPGVSLAAITGTNGKTTTTALVAAILRQAGVPGLAAGNIGLPLVEAVEGLERGVVAVEMSSFQLDTIRDFRAQVAAILNITPDHLDRHHTMERYVAAKARVLCNQQPEDWAVLNFEDPLVRGLAARAPGGVVFFSAQRRLDEGVFLWDGNIVVRRAGSEEVLIPRQRVPLRGAHNTENVLCACAVCLALGLSLPPVRAALENFRGVRHRLEEVRTLDGVLYVNDSKGTNPDSTIKALQSFSEPVVLIAGGRYKGGDLAPLARLVAERVAHVVLVGEAAPVMRDALVAAGCARVEVAPDFPCAVERARALARPGDVVLLSPACASWDMFRDYEQRGDLFCSLVQGFQEGCP